MCKMDRGALRYTRYPVRRYSRIASPSSASPCGKEAHWEHLSIQPLVCRVMHDASGGEQEGRMALAVEWTPPGHVSMQPLRMDMPLANPCFVLVRSRAIDENTWLTGVGAH